MTSRLHVALRHVIIAVALIVVIAWLWQLDRGPLAGPPLSVEGIRAWIERGDPVALAFVIVRFAALGFAGYLLALTIVSAVVRWLADPRAVRLVDRFTLPLLRGALGGAAAFGVLAVPPAPQPPPPTTVAGVAATDATLPVDTEATLHLLVPEAAPVVAPPVSADENTWIVQPGESLWLIARDHLTDIAGGPVDDETVDAYWRRLIDTNRTRLANPDDPDLIFASQELELPTVDAG